MNSQEKTEKIMLKTINTFFLGLADDNLDIARQIKESWVEQAKKRQQFQVKLNDKVNEILEVKGVTNIDVFSLTMSMLFDFCLVQLKTANKKSEEK